MIEYIHSQETRSLDDSDILMKSGQVGKRCLIVRDSDQGMAMMVAGTMRSVHRNAQRGSRRNDYWAILITIANQEFELAPGDVVRLYEDGENFDVFMLTMGNVGRFSSTSTEIDTAGVLDLGSRYPGRYA